MKHTHVGLDFSMEVVPLSVGAFERVLRTNRAAIGQVVEFMMGLLYDIPGVRAGRQWFSLVNVTCRHAGFSYGLCPPPPESASPVACTWLFTFALRGDGYNYGFVAKQNIHLGMQAVNWGRRGGEFLTLGTTHPQAGEFDLPYTQLACQQLYFLVGALTKSRVLNARWNTGASDYSQFYTPLTLSMAKTKWYMMPLYTAVRNVAYPMLVFNRHSWDIGVKMLSVKHITPESLLYLCQHIRRVDRLPSDVEDAVVDKFHESLTNFLQRRNAGEPATELWQVLWQALMQRGQLDDTSVQSLDAINPPVPTGNYKSHILGRIYVDA